MKPRDMHHVTVYRDENTFAAWPFNGGFWQFKDGELAVGFVRGTVDYADPGTLGHKSVDNDGGEHVVMRSFDGGETWPEDELVRVYTRPEVDEDLKVQRPACVSEKSYDPTADGWCLIAGFGIPTEGAPTTALVTVSTDRGRTWSKPVKPPHGGFDAISPRPSTLVRPDGMVLLFGHGIHGEWRPGQGGVGASAVVWASWDGGASWGVLGQMPRVPDYPGMIMPYPCYLRNGRILAAVRRQYKPAYNAYTQVYASDDAGRTWRFLSRVNDWGAPASLTLLPDDRLVCVYGYRQKPWGIRARVSEDSGETWGAEIVLRDDGASWDLGYPRTELRPDGSLITVYYFNGQDDPIAERIDVEAAAGTVRRIEATIWTI